MNVYFNIYLYLKHAYLEQKEQKIKKLTDENAKLAEDHGRSLYVSKTVYGSDKSNEVENLRRQVRQLEEKLRKQRPAERPYEQTNYKPRSKVNKCKFYHYFFLLFYMFYSIRFFNLKKKKSPKVADEAEPKVIVR